MTEIVSLPIEHWDEACSPQQQDTALRALEGGSVVLLPHLAFPLHETELRFLDPRLADAGKNISLNPANGALQGSRDSLEPLRGMVERYAKSSATLLQQLLPSYVPTIQTGRTSFRPVEVEGRTTSWRKDDTRLHVDSFPSSPTQGRRILRLFTNVHPENRPRTWRLGESFEGVARRYLPSLHRPVWGSSALLQALGITKSRRSAYDHFMLQLHDQMKADTAYQAQAAVSAHAGVRARQHMAGRTPTRSRTQPWRASICSSRPSTCPSVACAMLRRRRCACSSGC